MKTLLFLTAVLACFTAYAKPPAPHGCTKLAGAFVIAGDCRKARDAAQQRCMKVPLRDMKPGAFRDWCFETQKDMP